MKTKINLTGMAVGVALLTLVGSGWAAPGESSSAPAGAIKVKQPPTTSYMQSQVGTPNELSPLAPAEAKNVRKVGNQWLCDINGQTMVFDGASSCWEPQQK